jgi:hypothetical protein
MDIRSKIENFANLFMKRVRNWTSKLVLDFGRTDHVFMTEQNRLSGCILLAKRNESESLTLRRVPMRLDFNELDVAISTKMCA